jgi:phosphoribosylamine--glycine ligase
MLTPVGEFFMTLQGNKPKAKRKQGFQVGVRLVVPPFPFNDKETFEVKSKGSVIRFRKPTDGIHVEDVKIEDSEWMVAGTSGVVMIVCGTGQTMRQAQAQAYSRIRNIIIPHMYYRNDIGDRWYEDSDRLHNWGYLREI